MEPASRRKLCRTRPPDLVGSYSRHPGPFEYRLDCLWRFPRSRLVKCLAKGLLRRLECLAERPSHQLPQHPRTAPRSRPAVRMDAATGCWALASRPTASAAARRAPAHLAAAVRSTHGEDGTSVASEPVWRSATSPPPQRTHQLGQQTTDSGSPRPGAVPQHLPAYIVALGPMRRPLRASQCPEFPAAG